MDEAGGTEAFRPKFDSEGLMTAVLADARDGAVLMLAHMNADALRLTCESGIAHFWSRSRQRIWKKGESSGETFAVEEILVDCDQDALLLRVRALGPTGAACHTGRRSCFYRRLVADGLRDLRQEKNP
jgi:phosphoribosyl-AMP cyclohydrolase